MKLNDPELVRRQYESDAGLAVRRDAHARFREGPSAFETALDAVIEARPRRVLEVGCGMGEFAERLERESSAEVVATDLSPRMVEVAKERGVDARVADVQELPFGDGEFDCVVANAMPDHMAELWQLVGFTIPFRPFSRENGEEQLLRHFAQVERRDVDAVLVFPDAPAVRRYVESTLFSDAVPRPVPEFEGAFRSRTRATVFVAER